MAVIGASHAQAQQHIGEAFALWERRSRVVWEVDLGMLADVGVAAGPRP